MRKLTHNFKWFAQGYIPIGYESEFHPKYPKHSNIPLDHPS